MATREYQCSFQNKNNLPEDRYVNVLYFDDVGSIASRQLISDAIASAYTLHLQARMADDVGVLNIRVYPLGLNLGGPEVETTYPFSGASAASPHEVALCLSYYAVNNQPRTRGRIYLGPWGGAGARPNITHLGDVMAFGRKLADIADATWKLHSRTPISNVQNITNFWVDNAWDTMRSRGPSPTSRSTAVV